MIRKSKLPPNPFNKVNTHRVYLLNVQKLQQTCCVNGKDANLRI